MHTLDNSILELLDESGLVLSPSIIAYNLDESGQYVRERLAELRETDLINRPAHGKYEISDYGSRYLAGELSDEEVQALNEQAD